MPPSRGNGHATPAHIITYGEWRNEMSVIADLAGRAGVVPPRQLGPVSATLSSTPPPVGAAVAPSWDRLLRSLQQYPYGDSVPEKASGVRDGSGLKGADALFEAIARVDRVLLALAQESRVADLASSHTAEAQTLTYRALLYHHAHLLFQQQLDAVMAYEKAAAPSPSVSSRPLPSRCAVETYSSLVAQVSQLYTSSPPFATAAIAGNKGARRSTAEEAGAAEARGASTARASSAPGSTTTRAIDPSTHLLPSSSATAAAALAQHQLHTAGREAISGAVLEDVPHSCLHPTWFSQMQRRQVHFLLSEARDYQAAARLWMRIEQARMRLSVPTQDDALALSVVCTTMACGVLLRDTPPESVNPYGPWQYERAARRLLGGGDTSPGTSSSLAEAAAPVTPTTTPWRGGSLSCDACGGELPVAAPRHLSSMSGLLAGLARNLEKDLACVEQAVNFYELAAVVLLRQVPQWWTLGVACLTEETVAKTCANHPDHADDATSLPPPASSSTSPSPTSVSGPAAVAAALHGTSAGSSSWWGGFVTQLTSTFTRDGTATPESPEVLRARRAQEQRVREVRARLSATFAARWRACVSDDDTRSGDGGGGGRYAVYDGHWPSFEVAMEGAIRCAVQCQEYSLALMYSDVLLSAMDTAERASVAPRPQRTCRCPSAVWRRRSEARAATTTTIATTTTPTAHEIESTRQRQAHGAFRLVRARCLVRMALMHLVLHDDTSSSPVADGRVSSPPLRCDGSGGSSLVDESESRAKEWVRQAKQQVHAATLHTTIDAVSGPLCALVDLIGNYQPTHQLVGAAMAEQAWRRDYLYPPRGPRPAPEVGETEVSGRPRAHEAPLDALPAVVDATRASRSTSGVFRFRQSPAYAAVKQRARAARPDGARPDCVHANHSDGPGGPSHAGVPTNAAACGAPDVVLGALWDLLASLLALVDVVSQSSTAPLQRMPRSLVPFGVTAASEPEDDVCESLRRAEPAAVRRRVEAELMRLERALSRLALFDGAFGVLQQRLRAHLFFPRVLQP